MNDGYRKQEKKEIMVLDDVEICKSQKKMEISLTSSSPRLSISLQ